MEVEERTKPVAIFMAFGTKGDVYPIAVSPFQYTEFEILWNYFHKHTLDKSNNLVGIIFPFFYFTLCILSVLLSHLKSKR